MSRIEKVEFTNMCMVCDDNKVVVIDRQKKDWAGITFPGGHVAFGETTAETIVREFKEEIGADIKVERLKNKSMSTTEIYGL